MLCSTRYAVPVVVKECNAKGGAWQVLSTAGNLMNSMDPDINSSRSYVIEIFPS
jgi:hypothetical protein